MFTFIPIRFENLMQCSTFVVIIGIKKISWA